MPLTIEAIRDAWINETTGNCEKKDYRMCGSINSIYFQACVHKDIGCPIRDVKIVKKNDAIVTRILEAGNKLNSDDPAKVLKEKQAAGDSDWQSYQW